MGCGVVVLVGEFVFVFGGGIGVMLLDRIMFRLWWLIIFLFSNMCDSVFSLVCWFFSVVVMCVLVLDSILCIFVLIN